MTEVTSLTYRGLGFILNTVQRRKRSLSRSYVLLWSWKRLWCWKGLGARGEGDDRGWDGWMASLTRWTWVWVNSGSWWWTGRPGVLWFMGLQGVSRTWLSDWSDLIWLSLTQITMPPKLNSGEAKGRTWGLQKIESNSFWSTISVARKSDTWWGYWFKNSDVIVSTLELTMTQSQL